MLQRLPIMHFLFREAESLCERRYIELMRQCIQVKRKIDKDRAFKAEAYGARQLRNSSLVILYSTIIDDSMCDI